MATDIPVGAIVEIPMGRGIVRFCGQTSFQVGKWIGVELSEPKGKNDGSVHGIQYFSCKMLHGVFVKPSQVTLVKNPEPDPQPGPSRPAALSRPSLGLSQSSSKAPSRASSVRSAQPSAPSTRSGSPAKVAPSPTPSATVRGSRLAPPSPTKRSSVASTLQTPTIRRTAPSTTTARRRSSILDSKLSSSTSMPPPARPLESPTKDTLRPTLRPISFKMHPTSPPHAMQRTVSAASQSSSLLSPLGSDLHASQSPIQRASDGEADSPAVLPPSLTRVVPDNEEELQELRAKVRVFDAHRADDARRVRELEVKLAEAESFVALRPKLQAKLTQQQTELIALRRELADAKQLGELSEGRFLDAQEQLEMATLDKETAEELAESAQLEIEELKERLAVVEVELKVYKDGTRASGEGDEGVDPTIAGSLPYIQLEKQNARLKEALIRLRDVSSETELEQRRRIQEMEKDVAQLDELQNELESAYIKLSNSETEIEDLKVQLDDALGAEEMLVQLTERNLMLGEKIEEMRITIEDLEALRELNDELEENHVETEKEMQEEINEKDVHINQQQHRIDRLEEACQDFEGTIGQFRDLVIHLQTELDQLRAQTQVAQSESAAAASQSAQMMSLNIKLQSSASKNQARAIELEVKRIDARESRELLGIVQPYLPQLYVESDSDATQCYLFFKRLAAKADLINLVTAQAHGLPDALNGNVSEVLVGVTEMRGSIATLSILCRRFAAILLRCDVESFLNIGRLYPELAPMEKRIDMHIDLLRREEFREVECVSDINKMQAQFKHLVDTYFQGFEFDVGERELGFALSLDHDLDIYAAAIGLTKTAVADALKDEDLTVDLAGIDSTAEFFEPMQRILDQSRSAKTISKKFTKRLEDLIADSSALNAHLAPKLKALSDRVYEFINFGIQLAQQVMPHITDARASKAPFHLGKVISFIRDTALATVGSAHGEAATPWEALTGAMTQLIQEANALLPKTMENENVIKIQGTPPWVVRVDEIKAMLAVNVEAERKLTQLNEEMQGLVRTLRIKDQSIQELTVKIELMERRMEGVKRQQDALAGLEAELVKARKQERSYEDALEQLQADLDAVEQENTRLKTAIPQHEKQTPGAPTQEVESIPVEGNLETSHLLEQIEAFRGAVRFLRMENEYLKGYGLVREIEALPPLPESRPTRASTPPLEPSAPSDSDTEGEDEARTPPPTLRSLATERKVLYRRVVAFASTPKVVDLSERGSDPKKWTRRAKLPAMQILERKKEAEKLSRRVQDLIERTNAVVALRR